MPQPPSGQHQQQHIPHAHAHHQHQQQASQNANLMSNASGLVSPSAANAKLPMIPSMNVGGLPAQGMPNLTPMPSAQHQQQHRQQLQTQQHSSASRALTSSGLVHVPPSVPRNTQTNSQSHARAGHPQPNVGGSSIGSNIVSASSSRLVQTSINTYCFIDVDASTTYFPRSPEEAEQEIPGHSASKVYKALITVEPNDNDPRIVQIGAVAISKQEFQRVYQQSKPADEFLIDDNLTTYEVTVNPEYADELEWKQYHRPPGPYLRSAYEICGVSRDKLEASRKLPEVWTEFLEFLSKLPSPLCLIGITHGQHKRCWDFRMIHSETRRLSLAPLDSLASVIWIADSEQAFVGLDEQYLQMYTQNKDKMKLSDRKRPFSDLSQTPAMKDRYQKFKERFKRKKTGTLWHSGYMPSLPRIWQSHFGRISDIPRQQSCLADARATLRLALLYGMDFLEFIEREKFKPVG